MQHQALAVGEAQPHAPALPGQLVAVERERHPLGLRDLQGLPVGAQLAGRAGRPGRTRRCTGGTADVARVVDLQELHRVEVDDELQPGHRVRVRVAARGVPHPDVAPADAPPGVPLGDEVRAVGPHVDEHELGVGDPPGRERGAHLGVGAHRRVAVVPLVDRGVRLAARLRLPRGDGVVGEREVGDEGQPVAGAPQHRAGRAGHLVAGTVGAHDVLGAARPARSTRCATPGGARRARAPAGSGRGASRPR